MEKLIILDYGAQDVRIHIYNIDSDADIDYDYIEALGFNPDECIWHFATSVDILHHKEILK